MIASPDHLTRDFLLVSCVILVLYYFGHRADWDDANYVNLAAKIPITHGYIYQFDTMVGDGPHSIHLPTYRIQSYELLAGTLSYLLGIEPIVALHLILPAGTLFLLACVLCIALRPFLGQYWPAAVLMAIGIMYADTDTFTSWGSNGLVRFQQGKGALVTLIPLFAAALTVRWFERRQRIYLLAIALLHVSAIGLSANGLFVSPAASAFVGLALLCAKPKAHLRPAAELMPTLIYPAAVGASILYFHLAVPSEVTGRQDPFSSFSGVLGWGAEGVLFMAVLPLLPLVPVQRTARLAAAYYLPVALLLLMIPPGWRIASAITGNLGFRLFWAIPGPFIFGAVSTRILQLLLPPIRYVLSLALGAVVLLLGLLRNEMNPDADKQIQWHLPGLRAPRRDYQIANYLASVTPTGCKALVPDRYAVWIAGLRNGPYLVSVESLYLTHYRFTEPSSELTARRNLFDLVQGKASSRDLPSVANIQGYDMRIGLVATGANNPRLATVEKMAGSLALHRLSTPFNGIVVWVGSCESTSR